MGVLACSRQNCKNIMCDFYSEHHGYLCCSCRGELIETLGSMTVDQFMDTPKLPEGSCDPRAWKKYIEGTFQGFRE